MNPYETDRLLAEYLLFHYGAPEEVLPWAFGPREALGFAERSVRDCVDAAAVPPEARALDLGCAVGRASFELATLCAEVIGVDFSQRFIEAAQALQEHGELAYARVDEGDLTTPLTARVPAGLPRERVNFEVGDAIALRPGLGTFDVVLMANLIDRLTEPRRALEQLPALVRPGGQLVITSPYTWLPEFTPKEHWLGGREGRSTLAALQAELDATFVLTATRDLPMLIREHARKYQWSVAQATTWRRR